MALCASAADASVDANFYYVRGEYWVAVICADVDGPATIRENNMIIEVKGVEFCNNGSELMLHSIMAMLAEQLPGHQLVLSPGHLLPYQQRARLGAWQKFSFQLWGLDWTWMGSLAPAGLRRLLRHFGIVVEKDIDVVLDASGFVYSDNWGRQRLQKTLKQIKRCSKYDTQYIFLSQAFGPFHERKNKRLMQSIVAYASLVIARDKVSLRWLNESVGKHGKQKIRYFPDFTPLLEPNDINLALRLPQKFVCIIPNSKMFLGKSPASKQMYLKFLNEVILAVRSLGLTLFILNHEGKKDQDICLELLAKLDDKPQVLSDLSGLEMKKIISLSLFCVSSRFHACVSGLSQGVPVLATSWSHKYEELYQDYQCPSYILDITEVATGLSQKMLQLVAQRSDISLHLLRQSESHKARIRDMWSEVFNKICL